MSTRKNALYLGMGLLMGTMGSGEGYRAWFEHRRRGEFHVCLLL
jgi:hypothetical protein